MDTAKIDDSDLVAIEIYIAFAEGLIFAIVGLAYAYLSEIKIKRQFGYGCLGVTLFIWL